MNTLLSLSLVFSLFPFTSFLLLFLRHRTDLIHYFRSLSSSKRCRMCMSICRFLRPWIDTLTRLRSCTIFPLSHLTNDVIKCLYNLIIIFHVIDTHDNGLNWYNSWISSSDVSHFLFEVKIDHLMCPHSLGVVLCE